MSRLTEALFAVSPEVRYVAVLQGKELTLQERAGIAGASAAETDRYEELLVNPAILTLLGRRGEIDCGGSTTSGSGTATSGRACSPRPMVT